MTPQHRKSRCSKPMVNGKMVNQPEALLDVWAQHLRQTKAWNMSFLHYMLRYFKNQ